MSNFNTLPIKQESQSGKEIRKLETQCKFKV